MSHNITSVGSRRRDLLVICESVLVGIVVECFRLGHDSKVIDLPFEAARKRLAKVRLEDLKPPGKRLRTPDVMVARRPTSADREAHRQIANSNRER